MPSRLRRAANSNSAQQHKNDHNDQDSADDADAAVSVAVTVTAEAATEPAKQENNEDDDEDKSQRHGRSLQFVVSIGIKSQAGVCAILLIPTTLEPFRRPLGRRAVPLRAALIPGLLP